LGFWEVCEKAFYESTSSDQNGVVKSERGIDYDQGAWEYMGAL